MLNKHGDTIVEVMIAIVILGMALGGAFYISNKSSLRVQANHERYQAQMLANEEVEKLRLDYISYIAKGNLRASYEPLWKVGGVPGGDTSLCYVTACTNVNPPQNYTVEIQKVASPGSVDSTASISLQSYRVIVTWGSLVDKSESRVELLYAL